MSDLVATLLARITAGTSFKGSPGSGTNSQAQCNLVMAALGMGKAGRAGTFLLLANYCDDENARRWAIDWATRFAWITWLKVAPPGETVTTGQMTRLAAMAVGQHIDPEAGRRTSVKAMAELVGVNHQTFNRKYKKHLERIKAEIAYQESQAMSALISHLG